MDGNWLAQAQRSSSDISRRPIAVRAGGLRTNPRGAGSATEIRLQRPYSEVVAESNVPSLPSNSFARYPGQQQLGHSFVPPGYSELLLHMHETMLPSRAVLSTPPPALRRVAPFVVSPAPASLCPSGHGWPARCQTACSARARGGTSGSMDPLSAPDGWQTRQGMAGMNQAETALSQWTVQ